jgi:hypothetical protein
MKMPAKNPQIEQAVEKLAEKAELCFERAEAQHKIADIQHANAEKLAVLGLALEADAVALNGELEMVAGRNSPPLREQRPADRRRLP